MPADNSVSHDFILVLYIHVYETWHAKRVILNAASVCFVFEQLCGEPFLRASRLALFFSFTNDGIFLHLYIILSVLILYQYVKLYCHI